MLSVSASSNCNSKLSSIYISLTLKMTLLTQEFFHPSSYLTNVIVEFYKNIYECQLEKYQFNKCVVSKIEICIHEYFKMILSNTMSNI